MFKPKTFRTIGTVLGSFGLGAVVAGLVSGDLAVLVPAIVVTALGLVADALWFFRKAQPS